MASSKSKVKNSDSVIRLRSRAIKQQNLINDSKDENNLTPVQTSTVTSTSQEVPNVVKAAQDVVELTKHAAAQNESNSKLKRSCTVKLRRFNYLNKILTSQKVPNVVKTSPDVVEIVKNAVAGSKPNENNSKLRRSCIVKLRRLNYTNTISTSQEVPIVTTAPGVVELGKNAVAESISQNKNNSKTRRNCTDKLRRFNYMNKNSMSSINVAPQIEQDNNHCFESQVTTTDFTMSESQSCQQSEVKLLSVPMRPSTTDAVCNNIPMPSEGSKLCENLANKSDIIEHILLSEEDVEVQNTHKTGTIPKMCKFFHREKKEDTNLVACSKKESNLRTKTKNARIDKKVQFQLKNRRRSLSMLSKRRTSVGNVYDFLSQSQTSDTDPNSDIIKKLIASGKVTVATNCKGKGRPIIKRKTRVRGRRVVRQENKKLNLKSKHLPVQKVALDDDGRDDYDDYCNETVHHDENYENNLPKAHDVQTEGTFSHLARSVIIQQAGKNINTESRQRLADRKKLLEAARKFVSTPVKNKLPADHMAEMSPITPAGAPTIQMGCASPWRVNDYSHLPSVFHFATNASNMPSISSDNIPATPRKQNKQKSVMENSLSVGSSSVPSPIATFGMSMPSPVTVPAVILTKATTNSASLSYSSNDSNAENKPPSSSTKVQSMLDENEEIFNSRQLPNPRRSHKNRSPLKSIQILDVVTLAPWKDIEQNKKTSTAIPENINTHNINNDSSTEKSNDISGFEFEVPTGYDNVSNKSTNANEKAHNKRRPNKKSTNLSIFGFEEFLEDADDDDDDGGDAYNITSNESNVNRQHSNVNSCNASLREKLHKLQKWRPADDELTKPVATTSKNAQAMLFEERFGKTRQRSIKQMLCSTMIQSPLASRQTTTLSYCDDNENNMDNSELFKDPDPELTFNEKMPHRTYVRQFKRKRKLRHNFVMFLDSDASEEDEDEQPQHKKKTHSNDINSESEDPGAGHKRKKRTEKPNAELNSFVSDFNDMCKEVEQYQLVVE